MYFAEIVVIVYFEPIRTASDLEESGVIDKYQKGVIKDLIISGDLAVLQSLDKCEKGDTSSLEGTCF